VNRIQEPAPGIRLITLPLPFELEHVNVALVRLDEGYLLVDTGMAGSKSFHALESALDECEVHWTDIRTVLATHIHPDHVGCAPRVLASSGAKLLIHRAEFEYLNSILAGDTPWVDAGFTEGGVPRDVWDAIHSSLLSMRGALPVIQPDRLLEGGEEIATALGAAQVVPTPGHSAGHVCLYWPGKKLLYAGDHMIEKITPNIAWMPECDMLGQYLDSLSVVEALDVALVISSHGSPFGHHREWVAATRRHHDARCEEILRHLSPSRSTAYELVPAVWDRDFSSFHLYFALFEVLAHLEHMFRRGRVGFEANGSGSRRWFALERGTATAG
jgi:glyoxylase-like metal-dependent hydrolase (beta-lactamase superfamily II)